MKTYNLILRTLRIYGSKTTRIVFISVPSIFEFFNIRYDEALINKFAEWRKWMHYVDGESSEDWVRAYACKNDGQELPSDVDFVRLSCDARGHNEEEHLACNLDGFFATIDFIKECVFPYGWKVTEKDEYVWREQVVTQATAARVHQRLFKDVEATRQYVKSGKYKLENMFASRI